MEIAYGTTRFRRRLDYVLNVYVDRGLDSFPPPLIEILRLSAYQIVYLSKVPDFAVVNDAVELARREGYGGLARVVNGILRGLARGDREVGLPEWSTDPAGHLEIVHSHPRHLVEIWLERWSPDKVHDLCRFNNSKASHFARINRLRARDSNNRHELLEGCSPHPSVPDCVSLGLEDSPSESALLLDGYVTVQDPAAMLVAPLLDPKPEMRVWDVCAAPGGKCTHLAELMDDRGTVVASDLSRKRLDSVRENVLRLGSRSIEMLAADGLQPPWTRNDLLFDGILLDVPCTGWGTFRRHPDLRWRLSPGDPERLGSQALSLLSSVSRYLRPGGILVYSTCTLSREENEEPVRRFLEVHSNWRLDSVIPWLPHAFQDMVAEEGWITVFPPDMKMDGLFAARLRRTR